MYRIFSEADLIKIGGTPKTKEGMEDGLSHLQKQGYRLVFVYESRVTKTAMHYMVKDD